MCGAVVCVAVVCRGQCVCVTVMCISEWSVSTRCAGVVSDCGACDCGV